jgi:hypothetical protein
MEIIKNIRQLKNRFLKKDIYLSIIFLYKYIKLNISIFLSHIKVIMILEKKCFLLYILLLLLEE